MPKPTKKRKKVTQKQVTRLAESGADIAHKKAPMALKGMEDLLEQLKQMEQSRIESDHAIGTAMTSLAEAFNNLPKPDSVDISEVTKSLKRIEQLLVTQRVASWEFDFEKEANGFTRRITGKPVYERTH